RKDSLYLERYLGHATVVSSIAYHPFGRVFFSGDWRGRLNAWLTYDSDPHEGRYDENIFGGLLFSEQARRAKAKRSGDKSIERLLVSSDGEFLFVATETGSLELWRVRGFRQLATVQA